MVNMLITPSLETRIRNCAKNRERAIVLGNHDSAFNLTVELNRLFDEWLAAGRGQTVTP